MVALSMLQESGCNQMEISSLLAIAHKQDAPSLPRKKGILFNWAGPGRSIFSSFYGIFFFFFFFFFFLKNSFHSYFVYERDVKKMSVNEMVASLRSLTHLHNES